MNEKDAKQVRINLTKNLIVVQKRLFKRDSLFPDYEKDYQHLKEVEEVIEQIEQLTHLNLNLQNILLGKEFQTTDAIGRVGSIRIPLYLYLDTIKLIISEVLDSTSDLYSEKQEIITNISILRSKLTQLKYNNIFDSKKTFSEEAKKAIKESNGNFYYKLKEVGNESFVAIVSVKETSNNIKVKSSISNKEVIVFEEDKEHIEEIIKRKEDASLIKLKNKLAGYFINNEIPQKNQNIESCLKNQNLNSELKKCILQSVTTITNRQFSYVSYEELLNKLNMYETYIAEEKYNNGSSKYMFERYKGIIDSNQVSYTTSAVELDEFENARREQLEDDENIRNGLFIQE